MCIVPLYSYIAWTVSFIHKELYQQYILVQACGLLGIANGKQRKKIADGGRREQSN